MGFLVVDQRKERGSMGKKEQALLQEILGELKYLHPPISKFQVEPSDPGMSYYLLDLDQVCYITSRLPKPKKASAAREEGLMLVTVDGERYYSGMELGEAEGKLAGHPDFLRTAKAYIVNLARVRGFKYSNTRDLFFDGLKKPVINAVTSKYKDVFDAAIGIQDEVPEEDADSEAS